MRIRPRHALLAGLLAGALGTWAAPAGAELRTLTVTLLGGAQVSLTVDVPPGTPVDQIPLPKLPLPVISVTEGPPPPGAPTTPGVSVGPAPSTPVPSTPPPPAKGGSSSSSSSPASPARPSPAPARSAPGRARQTRQPRTAIPAPVAPATRPARHAPAPLATSLRLPDGAPALTNPTISVAVPGAAPPGVPDFFIEHFRIPPFLIQIYQAAGTEYAVPWQVLAAINEIETDYGRDLSTSTAGAVGWMQFLPSEWEQYGVDATGAGVRDPFNPADAIFAAARYLHAAGASRDLRGAIFAYNHATWYVDSVLLRAQLIGGMPAALLRAVTGLTQGVFPVQGRARYADDVAEAAKGAAASPAVAHRPGIEIFARSGAAVVAVNDSRVLRIATAPGGGRLIELRDVYGNHYILSGLGAVAPTYPIPVPRTEPAAQIARELQATGPSEAAAAPSGPATAGTQPPPSGSPSAPRLGSRSRLFAHPDRPAAMAATALAGLAPGLPGFATFNAIFTRIYDLARADVRTQALRVGSELVAGTVIGRIGAARGGLAPHVLFEVRPAGRGAPLIDPKPLLDGWLLLQRTSLLRARGSNPFVGQNPTSGEVLLLSKAQLEQRALADPHVTLPACARREIAAGTVDQRVLAAIEYLASEGIDPTVASLRCGPGATGDLGTGQAVDLVAFDHIPVAGHDGPGSVTEQAIRRLAAMQGSFQPLEIDSHYAVAGAGDAVALPGLTDRVHVTYRPSARTSPLVDGLLNPGQWTSLIGRLGQLGQPIVPSAPSAAALPDTAVASG